MPSLTLKTIFFPFGAPRYISMIWPHQAGRFYFLSQLTVFRDQVPTYLLGLITNHCLLHSSHTDLLLVPEHTKVVPAFKPLLLLFLLPAWLFPQMCAFSPDCSVGNCIPPSPINFPLPCLFSLPLLTI